MAFIQSSGALEEVQSPAWYSGILRTGVRLYDQFNYDYATLYRTQPNVRTCVDFLARNIAQLGLHVFRRISDNDRERLTEHGLALILKQPMPPQFKMTTFRLIEAMMGDLGIYFNAYWLKIRREGQLSLLRIPPVYVTPTGGLVPTEYEVSISGVLLKIKPADGVHFRGYNPENAISGLSPLETLRRVLAEEQAAGNYREYFWRNSARQGGLVKRPAGAPEWSDQARERFKAEFEALYSGDANSGKTAVLEEGMEWQSNMFNAQESEYLGGRKLTREECARAYHIPPPLVGILDHATFSNIQEQHKNLYQDTLGPWLASIEQDIELQLLPEFEDTEGVYVEFNIAEKLQGDFEQQTRALQSAVGRPWMTANEARARMNLPMLRGDADALVTPLNVLVGGQASARDVAGPEQRGGEREAWSVKREALSVKRINSHQPGLRERHQQKWAQVLTKHYRRQEAAIVSRLPKALASDAAKGDIGGVWWDDERWNEELKTDLLRLNVLTASAWAELLAGQLDSEVSTDAMMAYLEEHSRIQAENINNFTREAVTAAIREPEPLAAVKDVFNLAVSVWAVREAISSVTSASNFGAHEAARAGGLTKKTWRVNSGNPRDEHAALNGVSVGIGDNFPNGMRWPGDPRGGAENNANCLCSVEFD